MSRLAGLAAVALLAAVPTAPAAAPAVSLTDEQTLAGARVGDSLAEVRWLQPDAKRAAAARWQLASASHADGRSTLYASIGRDGRISALVFVAAG